MNVVSSHMTNEISGAIKNNNRGKILRKTSPVLLHEIQNVTRVSGLVLLFTFHSVFLL